MSLNPDKLKEEKFGRVLLADEDFDDYVINHPRHGKIHIDSLDSSDSTKKEYNERFSVYIPSDIMDILDDVMRKYFSRYVAKHGVNLNNRAITQDAVKHGLEILNGKEEHSKLPNIGELCNRFYSLYRFFGTAMWEILDNYDDQRIADLRSKYSDDIGKEVDELDSIFKQCGRKKEMKILLRPRDKDTISRISKRFKLYNTSSLILFIMTIGLSDEFTLPSRMQNYLYNWLYKTNFMLLSLLSLACNDKPIKGVLYNYRNTILSKIKQWESHGKLDPQVKQIVTETLGGE